MELQGLNRIKTELTTPKKLLNNSTEMVKFYEETNFKFKRNNSHLLSISPFFPLIKKSRYKNVLIRTDNTAAMYNINKKLGAKNLYHTTRKI
jgi:hypothetical protein